MNARLTTSVILSEDGHELILKGPRTGIMRLRFSDSRDTTEVFELLQDARKRCWMAFLAERTQGCSPDGGPGEATREILGEIITIAGLAMETADVVE